MAIYLVEKILVIIGIASFLYSIYFLYKRLYRSQKGYRSWNDIQPLNADWLFAALKPSG